MDKFTDPISPEIEQPTHEHWWIDSGLDMGVPYTYLENNHPGFGPETVATFAKDERGPRVEAQLSYMDLFPTLIEPKPGEASAGPATGQGVEGFFDKVFGPEGREAIEKINKRSTILEREGLEDAIHDDMLSMEELAQKYERMHELNAHGDLDLPQLPPLIRHQWYALMAGWARDMLSQIDIAELSAKYNVLNASIDIESNYGEGQSHREFAEQVERLNGLGMVAVDAINIGQWELASLAWEDCARLLAKFNGQDSDTEGIDDDEYERWVNPATGRHYASVLEVIGYKYAADCALRAGQHGRALDLGQKAATTELLLSEEGKAEYARFPQQVSTWKEIFAQNGVVL